MANSAAVTAFSLGSVSTITASILVTWALNLNFNWERKQLIGSETMTFKPLVVNLQRIELDACDARVRARAVAALGKSNDPSLAVLYEKL